MKNTKLIIAAMLVFLVITGLVAAVYAQNNRMSLEKAKFEMELQEANAPSQIDLPTKKLDHDRKSRQEDQKEIDSYQEKINVILEAKKEKSQRADEIQKELIELQGITVFQ